MWVRKIKAYKQTKKKNNNNRLLDKLFVLFIQTWIHSKPNAIIDNKLQEKKPSKKNSMKNDRI